MVKGLKVPVSGPLLQPLLQSDCTKWLFNHPIDDAATLHVEKGSCAAGVCSCEHAIAMTLSPLPPWPLILVMPSPSLVSELTAAVKKRKRWDRAYYVRKKLHAATAVAPSASTVATTFAAAADPWSVKPDGTVHMPSARKMANHQCVKPTNGEYPPRRKS
jgi:hypothetical protein